jgi:hypothetical protein
MLQLLRFADRTARSKHLLCISNFSVSKLSSKDDGLTLQDFINKSTNSNTDSIKKSSGVTTIPRTHTKKSFHPMPKSMKFYIETYGCQMNVSDSEIVRGILLEAGHEVCDDINQSDLILANTCAIRENAEAKVWQRLGFFRSIKMKNRIGNAKLGNM